MDVLIPLLILFYVLSSILSAVNKSGQKKKAPPRPRQAQAPKPVASDVHPQAEKQRDAVPVPMPGSMGGPTMIWEDQPESAEQPAPAEPEPDRDPDEDRPWQPQQRLQGFDASDWEEDFDEDDLWAERPTAALVAAARARHPVFGAGHPRRLVDGVIWSEVLRRPRAQRPWPER